MELLKVILKNHIGTIFLFIISIFMLVITTSIYDYKERLMILEKTALTVIDEYEDIDREFICNVFQCRKIIALSHHKIFVRTSKNEFKRINWENHPKYKIINDIYIIDNKIAIYVPISFTYFVIDNEILFKKIMHSLLFYIPFIFALFLYILIISIKKEKETAILKHKGNETLLTNQSMIMISENIHHELNTPLEVIDNKIEKISKVIHLCLEVNEMKCELNNSDDKNIQQRKKCFNKLEKLKMDFEFIKTSLEQIYNILERMRSFKHIRYSNGNKSIVDIVENAFNIIGIVNSNFTFSYDNELKNYAINSTKFKNADLLGILINNFKNSLEATSSKIYVMFVGFNKGLLKIRVIDNGTGIPKKVQKRIFEPNFSTKSDDNTQNTIRGNGMYLNKQILKQAGGDTYLIETSNKGTTIELSIPAKLKN